MRNKHEKNKTNRTIRQAPHRLDFLNVLFYGSIFNHQFLG
uniref:Uncharacterized protein n=1 Tax=Nelumbo nucifera TaxID=4432 RepID=A0A822ZAI6_NELNU|nr:TPA_asm: hypothetical protein HUJ06_000352 [Nelumbo nucifera]